MPTTYSNLIIEEVDVADFVTESALNQDPDFRTDKTKEFEQDNSDQDTEFDPDVYKRQLRTHSLNFLQSEELSCQ